MVIWAPACINMGIPNKVVVVVVVVTCKLAAPASGRSTFYTWGDCSERRLDRIFQRTRTVGGDNKMAENGEF